MRTTITIDEGLLVALKRQASEADSTVSRLIEDAVRLALFRQPEDAEDRRELELVTYGRGGRFSGYNLDKTSALLELDDLERFGSRWSCPTSTC